MQKLLLDENGLLYVAMVEEVECFFYLFISVCVCFVVDLIYVFVFAFFCSCDFGRFLYFEVLLIGVFETSCGGNFGVGDLLTWNLRNHPIEKEDSFSKRPF